MGNSKDTNGRRKDSNYMSNRDNNMDNTND